ncbi:hypothetical protein D3C73_258750 [compost metagenome]
MAANAVRDGIEHAIFFHYAALQRRHYHHRFHGRTRFKNIGDGTVTHGVFRRIGHIVRVVRWAVGHRQHFAGVHVHQHCGTRLRLVEGNGVIQFTVNQRLQAFIDAQRQIVRRLAVYRGDVLDHSAIAVFTYGSFARLAGQPAIKALFDPFDPFAVNVGHADDMRSNLARRVVAARFLAQVDARQFQLVDVITNRRINLPGQIDKAPLRIGINTIGELIERNL